MRTYLGLFAAAIFTLGMVNFTADASAETCFNCNPKESTGSCSGANQCRGDRSACRKAGCKISGTASCSTAANVKICSAAFMLNDVPNDIDEKVAPAAPVAEDIPAEKCINCNAKESTGGCSGANQCRGDHASCRKAGCKITGTASCSTAGNVKICSSAFMLNDEPNGLDEQRLDTAAIAMDSVLLGLLAIQ